MPKPKVIGQPIASQHFTLGINTIADLLAPTLGPIGGVVCNQRDFKNQPELLDDSATTVRRILNLGDPNADVGAMLMRSMIWRVVQRAGDGGATAAVLTRELYADALRIIAGGANAMQVAKGVNLAVEAAVKAIRRQARPVNHENELAAVALTVVQQPGLAAVLGEMSYLLGPDAHVTIEKYVASYLQQSYHPGAGYKSQFASMYFYTDPVHRTAILPAGALVLIDGKLERVEEIVAILKAAKAAGAKALTIVAGNFTEEILGIMVANSRNQNEKTVGDARLSGVQQNGAQQNGAQQDGVQESTAQESGNAGGDGKHQGDKKGDKDAEEQKMLIVGVKLKDVGDDRRAAYDDLGMLTGATVLGRAWSKPITDITGDDLGKLLRTEVTKDYLHVVPERFHTQEVREKTAELRRRLSDMTLDDEQRPLLVKRLSALSGGMGVLKIGAESKLEREVQATNAERALKVLSAAQTGGMIPGGGAAYFHAAEALNELDAEGDMRFGVEMVQRALCAPLRQILENAHVSAPSWHMELIRTAGPDATYDVLSTTVGDAFELGVLDVAEVAEIVLRTAVSSALMALTTDTIIYHKNPKQELNLA